MPDPIYAKIELQDVDDFVVRVHQCWATPTNDEADVTRYDFINDYMVLDGEKPNVDMIENCLDTTAAFKMNTFSFGDSANVYIHCTVDICDSANDCSCSATIARKRRQADKAGGVSLINIGPIAIGH